MRRVLLFDQDITKYVTAIPAVVYTAGEYGQLVVNDLPNLTGDNRRGFWDTGNQASPFYGATTLNNFPISIENDGVTIFSGRVQQIQADNTTRLANVILKSDVQAKLEKGIVYASSQADTPANLVKEICDLYKIPIDSASFGSSNALYSANLVLVNAFFQGDTDIQGALQTIAEIGCARIYVINGRIHFDAYQEKTADPIFNFSDDTFGAAGVLLFSHPATAILEKQPIEGYRVEHMQSGNPAIGDGIRGNENQWGKTISAGVDSPVRIVNQQSAVFIGELWFSYLNRKQVSHTIGIPTRYGKSLGLGMPISYSYRGRPPLTIDITQIDNSAKVQSLVTGVTR